MQANIVDLRYKMKSIIKALERNEKVTILYHGKEKGVIVPAASSSKRMRVADHPFFGMSAAEVNSVEETMVSLRGTRY